jgi:phytoene dehydrogenase-like protein
LVEGGRANGVLLASGEKVAAARVVANVNPRLLFERLVAPEQLPDDFRARIAGYRCGSGTFRMNVALSALPEFTSLPGTHPQPHHASGIVIAPSLSYMERAYFDARTRAGRRADYQASDPSVVDDSLAPPGCTSRVSSASTFIRSCRRLRRAGPGTTRATGRRSDDRHRRSRRAEFQGQCRRPSRAHAP